MTAVHRVDELRLAVAAAAGSEAETRARAERFTREVLERCGDLLEARFPGRLFFVRRLETRWALAEERLADAGEIESRARELAEGVEAAARRSAGTSGARAADSVAVFEDEADWQAGYLAARARGDGREWFFEALRERRLTLSRLAANGPPGPVLERLAASGALAAVLAGAGPGEVRDLASALDLPRDRSPGEEAPGEPATPLPSGAVAELARRAEGLTGSLSADALRLLLFVEARRRLGPAAAAASILAAAERAIARAPEGAREGAPERAPARSPAPAPVAPAASEEEPLSSRFATDHGGLFYLLTLALELRLGELLWQACLPEGEALEESFRALVGDEGAGDPALGFLAGAERSRGGVAPTLEQQREIARGALGGLVAALPRRGLAALPETLLGLHGDGGERLLLLVPAGSPFPLAAWPAGSTAELTAGIGAILDLWPASAAAPRALPALATAGPRLVADEGAALPAGLHLPAAGSVARRALLAQLAGAVSFLFAARAGVAVGSASELAADWLRVPAEVRVDAEAVTVGVEDRHLRIELRRSGLDRDPGWVPWLRRTVRFRFEGSESP